MWNTLNNWYEKRAWKHAHSLMPDLRFKRTEMRLFILTAIVREGPMVLQKWPITKVLNMRRLCGRRWFDLQLLVNDAGYEVSDPYRTIR